MKKKRTTFEITISDGYTAWRYPLDLDSHKSIERIHEEVCKVLGCDIQTGRLAHTWHRLPGVKPEYSGAYLGLYSGYEGKIEMQIVQIDIEENGDMVVHSPYEIERWTELPEPAQILKDK